MFRLVGGFVKEQVIDRESFFSFNPTRHWESLNEGTLVLEEVK
jgi:hypothetical protein